MASECQHPVIESWRPLGAVWSCATCSRRFYPACPECVTVGHRNVIHEATARDAAPAVLREALDRLFDAASVEEEDWSSATHDELVAALNQAGAALAAPAAPPTHGVWSHGPNISEVEHCPQPECVAYRRRTHEPAVDDFGNQYLARRDRNDVCHNCGQKMIVAYLGGGADASNDTAAPANGLREAGIKAVAGWLHKNAATRRMITCGPDSRGCRQAHQQDAKEILALAAPLAPLDPRPTAYRLGAMLEEMALAGVTDPFDKRDRDALKRIGYVRANAEPATLHSPHDDWWCECGHPYLLSHEQRPAAAPAGGLREALLYLDELHDALFIGSERGISKATLGEMAHEIKHRFLAASPSAEEWKPLVLGPNEIHGGEKGSYVAASPRLTPASPSAGHIHDPNSGPGSDQCGECGQP